MSIIASIRALIQGCPFIDDFSPVHVDYTDQDDPTNYGIYPTGETLVRVDCAGNELWQYNFVLRAAEMTVEDQNRIANNAFLERFCRWMQAQNESLPVLEDDGERPLEAESITAQNGQYVDVSEDGNSGTYEIQCNLVYERMV